MSDAPRLREVVPAERVRARIVELAAEIATVLGTDAPASRAPPLFIVIAEGARRFAEALLGETARRGVPADSMVVRARRTVGQQLVAVELEAFDADRCAGRSVVIVDDIADEGRTLAAVLARVATAAPARVRTAVLVSKLARRAVTLSLDWIGFELADGWLVGFGMDLDGRLRELDGLFVVEG